MLYSEFFWFVFFRIWTRIPPNTNTFCQWQQPRCLLHWIIRVLSVFSEMFWLNTCFVMLHETLIDLQTVTFDITCFYTSKIPCGKNNFPFLLSHSYICKGNLPYSFLVKRLVLFNNKAAGNLATWLNPYLDGNFLDLNSQI